MNIELSILIPAVFERSSWLMYDSLLAMVADRPVEVLALFDNKKRTLGAKRNALMAMAQGQSQFDSTLGFNAEDRAAYYDLVRRGLL
jgi:hypothetical protein